MNCHESKGLKANLKSGFPFPEASLPFSNCCDSVDLTRIQLNECPASGITKATCSDCPPPKAQSTPKRWPPKKRCVKICSAWPPLEESPLEVMKSIPLWPLRLPRQREGSTGGMPDDGRRINSVEESLFSLFFEKQSIWSYDTQAWQGRVSWTIIIAANF